MFAASYQAKHMDKGGEVESEEGEQDSGAFICPECGYDGGVAEDVELAEDMDGEDDEPTHGGKKPSFVDALKRKGGGR